jgi:DNA invertase Pin-like site-specific DNA recombinase
MGEFIGYARCSTVLQDLTAQREILISLGVPTDRIYLDKGLTSRARPGLDQALAAVRAGDTLVVPRLDRLARAVPDARGPPRRAGQNCKVSQIRAPRGPAYGGAHARVHGPDLRPPRHPRHRPAG